MATKARFYRREIMKTILRIFACLSLGLTAAGIMQNWSHGVLIVMLFVVYTLAMATGVAIGKGR